MIVAIHQPEHMPWSGFFHKMAQADVYVFLDNVQFSKNNWQNRNRIVARNGGEQWLTVPVELRGHMQSTIRDINIREEEDWRRKYLGRIGDSYSKHPFFKEYIEPISEILRRRHSHVWALNRDLIDFFRGALGIETPLFWASELSVRGRSTELLASIVTAVGGDTYLCGPGGAGYLDFEVFVREKIDIVSHQFVPPIYAARHGFVPGLSMLDVMMNYGEESASIVGIKQTA